MVAAYLLADAASRARRHCQAFPAFGAERRGAPVAAFVRIARRPILRRDEVKSPGFLIVQDATLLHESSLLEGVRPGGGVLLNAEALPGHVDSRGNQPACGWRTGRERRHDAPDMVTPAGQGAARHAARP